MTINVKALLQSEAMPTSTIAASTQYQAHQAQCRPTPNYLALPGGPTTVTETTGGVTSAQCSTANNNYGSTANRRAAAAPRS